MNLHMFTHLSGDIFIGHVELPQKNISESQYHHQPIKNHKVQRLSSALHTIDLLDKSGSQSSDSDKGLSRGLKSHDSFNRKLELPSKPTFSNAGYRDLSSGSPAFRQLKSSLSAVERLSAKGDNSGSAFTTESSSGSEQDAMLTGLQLSSVGKRNLRKTKTRGKGKGQVTINSSILDEFEFEPDDDIQPDADDQTNELHHEHQNESVKSNDLSENHPESSNLLHQAEVYSHQQ